MPTVTSENKAEFDREFLERKGMLKPKVKKEKTPSKYVIEPNIVDVDGKEKRDGWQVREGDFVHDVYPTKKYAENVIKKLMANK